MNITYINFLDFPGEVEDQTLGGLLTNLANECINLYAGNSYSSVVEKMIREVKVEEGIVRGLPAADPRITAFKGIPFAAPPAAPQASQPPRQASPRPLPLPTAASQCLFPLWQQHLAPVSRQPFVI